VDESLVECLNNMFLAIHLIIGAVIGAYIKNIPLAIAIALAIHYLLDIIPHIDYPIKNDERDQWRKLFKGGSKMVADFGVGLLAIFMFSDNSPFIYACALVSASPDFSTALKYLFPGNKILEKHYNFHAIKIHQFKDADISKFWRLVIQAIIVIISLSLLNKTYC